MFEEFNCFKIVVSAIFVCNPLSIFLTIIKVKHRCNCVYTKSVNVEFFYPVKRIGNEEVFDFIHHNGAAAVLQVTAD